MLPVAGFRLVIAPRGQNDIVKRICGEAHRLEDTRAHTCRRDTHTWRDLSLEIHTNSHNRAERDRKASLHRTTKKRTPEVIRRHTILVCEDRSLHTFRECQHVTITSTDLLGMR